MVMLGILDVAEDLILSVYFNTILFDAEYPADFLMNRKLWREFIKSRVKQENIIFDISSRREKRF